MGDREHPPPEVHLPPAEAGKGPGHGHPCLGAEILGCELKILHDAEIFWATDPEGFAAAEMDGELVGGGSIVSYGGRFGFMGFFIVAPPHRGRGLGRRLWERRKQALLARLDPGAAIGMDGELAGRDVLFQAGVFDEPLGQHGAFAVGDHPTDHVAAEDI